MKLLIDFLPLLAFFLSYKLTDIYTATAVLMVASALQVAYLWFSQRKLETMPVVVLGFALVFGTLTLVLRDEAFLKWKVTLVEWLLAGIFLLGPLFGKFMLKELLGKEIQLPDRVWNRINLAWGLSFLILGTANIYFIYNMSTEAWVSFKVWGLTGANLLMVIASGFYMAKHMPEEGPAEKESH
ncbi:MAG: septation protein A [Gammaproteobacteria bacterium]|nr:septation protein A [Gammaproteobacteria bacterium]